MKPKDLLEYLESGDRSVEDLEVKASNIYICGGLGLVQNMPNVWGPNQFNVMGQNGLAGMPSVSMIYGNAMGNQTNQGRQ